MKAVNRAGCILNMSKSDYERLRKKGIWLNIIEDEEAEKSDKIGIVLHKFVTGENNCASDRIRAKWIIKNSDRFEIYREGVNYETIIFHKWTPLINTFKGIKIMDLCDAVWKETPKFAEHVEPIDAFITSTQNLKDELGKLTNKKIYVIDDGHDLEYYQTKVKNEHKDQAKEAVWFGYAQNAHCLSPFFKIFKDNGIKLKVLAQCPLPPLNKADKFFKWDVDTCIEEISKSDFALLPKNGHLKSNNKDITAYLSGIPVAKTEEDILRLIDPKERQKDLKKGLELAKEYDAKLIAKKYEAVIDKIINDIEVYTAICGGYEKERNDIKVFTDLKTDKFIDPVMNAKVYKVLSHKFFDSKYTIWVDGNIKLKVEPKKIIELLGDADIAVFRHPYRTCLFDEYSHAKERVPENQKPLIDEQVKNYQNEGMPKNFGLGECGMIIRKDSPAVREFNNKWWAEICRYSRRDQISFPYVMWKMGDKIKIKFLEGNVRNHKYFAYENHHRS